MKNGQLWFNTFMQRVERIVACGPRVVASTYHKEDLHGWVRSQFRPATREEVEAYLAPVESKKAHITTEGKVVYV
jgi:hypothetical protein